MAPVSAYLKIGKVKVSAFRQGQGTPLLFLHGANGASSWTPFFEELSKSHDVIVPEHPGFGSSENPGWITSIQDVALFYLDFLEELELSRVALVGSSLGGWIAAELALRNATSLSSLTLLGPAGARVEGIAPPDMSKWGPEESVRNLFFNQSIADRMLSVRPTEAQISILAQNRNTATKLLGEPKGYNPDLEKWLHRIKIPTQIIWGAEDKLIPPAYAKPWKEQIPQATVSIVPQCGHLPHVEKSEAVVAAIRELTRNSS